MRGGLFIPLLVLAFVVLGLAVVMIISGRRKRLEARVAAAMPHLTAIGSMSVRSGSLVRLRQEEPSGWRALNWLLKMPIDLPLAHVISPILVLAITVSLAAATAWGAWYFTSWWASLLAALVMWIIVTRTIFGWELERYRGKLLTQLPDTIHLVISATRAGLPVSESFRTVVQEMPKPTSAEFARVVDEMSLGMAADEALLNMHRRTEVTEYAIFAVTIGVQARTGGRLVETISNLAETVRDRIAIKGKARALSTEARTSAAIMTVLPVIMGGVLSLTTPGYLNPLIHDPRGQTLTVIGLTTLFLGIVTMRQLIRGAVRD
jgi:tight adherence protein B